MKQSNVLTINQDRNRKRIKQCNLCGSLPGQMRRLLAFFTLVCSSLTGGYEAKPTCPTAAPGAQDGMAALSRVAVRKSGSAVPSEFGSKV